MTDSTPTLQPRAERTRARLMEATLESLVEHGYSGTSTAAVCRRAGVSRGTLLYHFPTREQMLVGALEHVLARRVAEFVDLRRGQRLPTTSVFVAELWQQWQGDAFVAWLELAVAARTDAALRAAMQPIMASFDQLVLDAFAELNPTAGAPPELTELVPPFVFALFNGLSIERGYSTDGSADAVVGLLALLAEQWGTGGSDD